MATQGNLFGQSFAGAGIESIFDAVGEPTTPIGGPAQRSAQVLMPHEQVDAPRRYGRKQRQFGIPSHQPGPHGQMAFNFSDTPPTRGSRFVKGFKRGLGDALGPFAILAEGAFAGAIVTAGIIEGSAQWGAPTGLEEDYVGGAVYGAAKGIGTATGGVGGGIGGFALGAGIGSIIPGAGTIVGGIIGLVGGVAGSIAGETIGSRIAQGPARQLGLGARAISRTARAIDRVQFGGNFVDSRAAHTMRQRAVADMSGSMLNARQFLGNEAIFLHER